MKFVLPDYERIARETIKRLLAFDAKATDAEIRRRLASLRGDRQILPTRPSLKRT